MTQNSVTMKAKKKETIPEVDNRVSWLVETSVIDGKKWVIGTGNVHASTLFVVDFPCAEDIRLGECFAGKSGQPVKEMAILTGVYLKDCYFTYAVKFAPAKKNPSPSEIRECSLFLQEEIKRINPRTIVCLGATAVQAVLEKKCKISDYRGVFTEYPQKTDIQVFTTYNPGYLLYNPAMTDVCKQDWMTIAKVQKGLDLTPPVTDSIVIANADDLHSFVQDTLASGNEIKLVLDCEWQGKTWLRPDRYIRTVQLSPMPRLAVVVKFREVDGTAVADEEIMWLQLKELLEDPRVKLIGHNVISDGEWLLTYGIDIRDNVWFDTMLAEHCINCYGPFGLEALAVKYTTFGRYDTVLAQWKDEHADLTQDGFGKIPEEILFPYAATDVDVIWDILAAQWPSMGQFMQPRGQYPSLWDTVLYTQRVIYELEMEGLLVDRDRLSELTTAFQNKRDEL